MLSICIILTAAVCILAFLCIKFNAKASYTASKSAEEISRLKAEHHIAEEKLAASHEILNVQLASKDKLLEETKSAYEHRIEELKAEHARRIAEEREALGEKFKALASDVLRANSLQLDERSRTSIETVLAPVKTKLEEFTKGFRECYDIENRDRLTLREEIKALHDLNTRVGTEASRLADALKGNTRIQGQWGEMVLTNILEHSGLQEGRWFVTQESTTDEDGSRVRPDAIIHCPKQRDIIIDSKASLSSYLQMLEADDEDARRELIDAHVKSVENHISVLKRKEYQEKIGAKKGDFVLMFMPHEGAYLAAMNAKPDLWQKAYDSHVIMVSPTHLVTVVRLVEQMWQTEDQTVNSVEIAETASKLLESLNSFMSDLNSVGEMIDKTQRTYDSAVKRLSTGNNNVIRVAKRLESLGVKSKKGIPEKFNKDFE